MRTKLKRIIRRYILKHLNVETDPQTGADFYTFKFPIKEENGTFNKWYFHKKYFDIPYIEKRLCEQIVEYLVKIYKKNDTIGYQFILLKLRF